MIGVFEFPGGARRPCIVITAGADGLRPGKAAAVYAHIVLAPGDMLEMAVRLLGGTAGLTSDGLFVPDPVQGPDLVWRPK